MKTIWPILLFLLLVVACTPAPKPTPSPAPTRAPAGLLPAQHERIFPAVWYSGSNGLSGKRGLAWHTTNCPDAAELEIHWYFDWASRRNSCPVQPRAFIPMWRPHEAHLWPLRIAPDYDGITLWLNEPNWVAQDDVGETAAAHLYREFSTVICPGCKTVVLNLAWADIGYLIEWREAYRAAYGEYPDPYAYGVHAYGSEENIIDQVETYRAALVAIGEADKKIWLTEFGGCWQGEQPLAHQLTPDEMGRVLAYLEAQSFVEGYAFFGVRWYKPGDPPPPGLHCESLFGDNGITTLGQVYAGHDKESGYPGPP